jgi:hypothetical protein
MQCVVDECRATAPAVTDDREGDVGACVSLYATCRDHLESCGLNDDCGRDHAITFQQGLAAVDCLETRCYRSCQR